MTRIRPKDIQKTELSKEEAIRQFGEDVAIQFDKYDNLCFKGEITFSLRFSGKKEKVEDTLFALAFPSRALREDKGKRFLDSYTNQMLIKGLEDQLSRPHPSYGKIVSYQIIK